MICECVHASVRQRVGNRIDPYVLVVGNNAVPRERHECTYLGTGAPRAANPVTLASSPVWEP